MLGRKVIITIFTDSTRIDIDPGLTITGTIKKTDKSKLNECSVTITNLIKSTIDSIAIGATVVIDAGYVDESVSTIFRGSVTDVSTESKIPLIETTITIKDGDKLIDKLYLSKTYSDNIKVSQMLEDVIKSSGYSLKSRLDSIQYDDITFSTGYSIYGTAKTVLNQLTDLVNLSWTIDNDTILLYDRYKITTETLQIVNKSTGLLGSPFRIKIKNTKTKKEVAGYKVVSRLLPPVEPHGRILLGFSAEPNGVYCSIVNIEHTFANKRGPFNTTLEVIDGQ